MARRTEDIDVWVGGQIAVLRRERGLSQSALANALGLSFQQIQKYEAGQNRVSAARLFQLAQLYNCDIADFFPMRLSAQTPPALSADARRMVHNYEAISDGALRRSVGDIVEALALRG